MLFRSDERLSVLGLILSRVNEELKKAVQWESYMERLQSGLLEFKSLTEAGPEGLDGHQLFSNVCQKLNLEYTKKKKAELLTWEEDKQYQRLLQAMERFQQALKLEGLAGKQEAFLYVKGLFGQENSQFEQQQDKASQTLEYAFDFLEGAFGAGQELVMFITELNSNYYSVKFLQDCSCERYYQYNQELLFDEKRRKLLERLQ